jgi:hypothetical protein
MYLIYCVLKLVGCQACCSDCVGGCGTLYCEWKCFVCGVQVDLTIESTVQYSNVIRMAFKSVHSRGIFYAIFFAVWIKIMQFC